MPLLLTSSLTFLALRSTRVEALAAGAAIAAVTQTSTMRPDTLVDIALIPGDFHNAMRARVGQGRSGLLSQYWEDGGGRSACCVLGLRRAGPRPRRMRRWE